MTSSSRKPVKLAFELTSLRIEIADIEPLRAITPVVRRSMKFAQIEASIREVGIIEPPVVVPLRGSKDRFQLLDGHLRIQILKERGETAVVCLIATEDEAFTYNKRISRLATVQEHKMILTAIERGVPEERLARALNVDIKSIRTKKRLLDGICPEVIKLLQDRQVPLNTFTELRRLRPMRQIEVAEIMIAMNRFSLTYAKSLVASTPQHQLVSSEQKTVRGLSVEQIDKMEREAINLDREFRLIEQNYSTDHLDLVLAVGYLSKLIDRASVVRFLARTHPEILSEFQKIAQLRAAA
ncbi:MAG: ParB N-terminal domain-containing protein [Sphingomonadales bacterium]|nr:ParB N-terminal domain-containing protein [Sphingomonadales bacterium]